MITYIRKNNDCYNIDIPDDFIQKWDNVKKYYTEAEVLNPIYIDKTFKKPNNNLIQKILSECNFNQYFIDNILDLINTFYIEHDNDKHKSYINGKHKSYINDKHKSYINDEYKSFGSYKRKYESKRKTY